MANIPQIKEKIAVYSPSRLDMLIQKVRIKYNGLVHSILFERLGVPTVRGEKISKSVLRKHLPKCPVIVDCGAHDGADSVLLASIYNATVYAFEPIPQIFSRLLQRAKKEPRIYPQNMALGRLNGEHQMYVSAGTSDASSSLLPPKEHLKDHPEVIFPEVVVVQVKTLDSWAKDNSVDKIDMLWLDMQGSELDMLVASPRILATVGLIHTEVALKECYEGGVHYSDLKDFLMQFGFNVLIEAIPEGADMGNVVFIKDR